VATILSTTLSLLASSFFGQMRLREGEGKGEPKGPSIGRVGKEGGGKFSCPPFFSPLTVQGGKGESAWRGKKQSAIRNGMWTVDLMGGKERGTGGRKERREILYSRRNCSKSSFFLFLIQNRKGNLERERKEKGEKKKRGGGEVTYLSVVMYTTACHRGGKKKHEKGGKKKGKG